MFHGQVRTSVDHKGRTSVPSNFRAELVGSADDGFMLAVSLDPCLEAYPAARWRDFGQRLTAIAAEHDVTVRAARRWYLGGVFTMALDGHGRVLLPPCGGGAEAVGMAVHDHLRRELRAPGSRGASASALAASSGGRLAPP